MSYAIFNLLSNGSGWYSGSNRGTDPGIQGSNPSLARDESRRPIWADSIPKYIFFSGGEKIGLQTRSFYDSRLKPGMIVF